MGGGNREEGNTGNIGCGCIGRIGNSGGRPCGCNIFLNWPLGDRTGGGKNIGRSCRKGCICVGGTRKFWGGDVGLGGGE